MIPKQVIKTVQYGLLVVFSLLMIEITLRYIPIRMDAAFLQIKQQYIGITHWKIAFFIHVFASIWVLLAGFTQFSPYILRHHKTLHRWMGKSYVWNILFVTGPAGLIMAFYANGGRYTRIAFIILAILWMGSTAMAWWHIMQKNIAAHKAYMLRSYALTFSAVTLRVWKLLIVLALHPRPMEVYMWVAWLGWVPNLLFVEGWMLWKYLQSRKALKKRPAA